jgi:hypothetical protein
MHAAYEDIRKRIKDEPLWFDENGTPRYDKFDPHMVSNIYASSAALTWIGCQRCGWKCAVAITSAFGEPRLHKAIKAETLHYGDPPWHEDESGEGCVGCTMNCEDEVVLQYWEREPWGGWVRNKELERLLPSGWDRPVGYE